MKLLTFALTLMLNLLFTITTKLKMFCTRLNIILLNSKKKIWRNFNGFLNWKAKAKIKKIKYSKHF
jgi:hypothetical protein